MNYKIRITAENQAIVKRIADENGMNPNNWSFDNFNKFYILSDNKFIDIGNDKSHTELTTEQFIEMFDKKETLVGRWFQALEDNASYSQVIKNNFYQICRESDREIHFKVPHHGNGTTAFGLDKEYENKFFKLMPKDFQPTQETEIDKWIKETKAKNLSIWELQNEIDLIMDKGVLMQLQGSNNYTKAQILFNQWNSPTKESPKVETEWQPKRGDRVLVWNNSEEPLNAIYLETVIGCTQPFLVVYAESEKDFLKGDKFDFITYKNMKPLPIEQPKETDFKTKVIEMVEKRIENQETNIQQYYESKQYHLLNLSNTHKIIYQDLLNKIKQL